MNTQDKTSLSLKQEVTGAVTTANALKMAIDVLQNYAQADSPVWRKALNACKEALATNKESSLVQPAQEKTLKSLRDEFAIAALSGAYVAQGGSGGWIQHEEKESLLILAKNFYKTADAMIKARELKDE
jgi:thymidine phosphorylase